VEERLSLTPSKAIHDGLGDMETKGKAFQRLVVAGYLGLTLLFIVIYFLAGYLPEAAASLATLLQDVALNLAIALAISFGSYVLFRPLIEDSNRKTLEEFQSKALDLLTLEKGVREAGVVRVYENLDMDILAERLNTAEKRVCFLSIWLSSQPERLEASFVDLSKRGVAVQVLQATPNSDICKIRANSQKVLFPDESSFEPVFISRIIEKNNAYFQKLESEQGTNVEVRLFDLLPPFSLILIDNSVFVRFYGYGEKAANTPHIEFRLGEANDKFNVFGAFVLSQFEMIWNKSAKAF
jgi:hypothetical protein